MALVMLLHPVSFIISDAVDDLFYFIFLFFYVGKNSMKIILH